MNKEKNFQLDIYNNLSVLEDILYKYHDAATEKIEDSINSLYFSINSYTLDAVRMVMMSFEDYEKVCYSCCYRNVDNARKSLLRYLQIETELTQEQRDFFIQVKEAINIICLALKSCKLNLSGSCEKVDNHIGDEAEDMRQAVMISRGYEIDDDDDEFDD